MVNIGDKFKCIKDVVMIPDGKVAYRAGKVYTSELEDCLTDEQGTQDHVVCFEGDGNSFLEEFFVSESKIDLGQHTNWKYSNVGTKETDNKSDYSEINLDILDLMSERMMANKHKYPKGNSKRPIPEGTLEWAMFRHIKKILKPIKNDPESKRDHLAAIACNVSMILDQMELVKDQEVPPAKTRTSEEFWKEQAEHWNRVLFGEDSKTKINKN